MSHFPLVSAQWLKGTLDDPSVVLLDATFHLPNLNRDARAEFGAERIPGARFFDVDGIKDSANPLPHMVPQPEVFADTVEALGVSNDTHIVCYDSYGLFSAARPWWMFRLFGHDKVSILDGGLPGWKAAGYPMETGAPEPPTRGVFQARFRPELVRGYDQVLDALANGEERIVDARPADRFDGSAPEPRPEVRGGHMPGALNVPFPRLTDPDTRKVQDIHGLESLFRKAGVKLGRDRVIASCGSGVTACATVFALHLLGDDTAAVYDGSWAEWGTRPGAPIDNPSES